MNEPSKTQSTVSRYLADIRKIASLSEDDEARLMHQIARGGTKAVNKLVESNLGFVVSVAREYRYLGVPFEDLLNEGNIGLIEAARRYDPAKGTRFITYAVWWIRKRILKALSERSSLVRVPDSRTKKLRVVQQAQSSLRQSLGRNPSRREVSRYLSMKPEQLDRLLQLIRVAASIDEVSESEEGTPLADLLKDIGITSEQRLIHAQAVQRVRQALDTLTVQQRAVLVLRFGFSGEPPLTLAEAGLRLGVSRERVRQVENQAVMRLRRLAKKKLLIDAPARPPGGSFGLS